MTSTALRRAGAPGMLLIVIAFAAVSVAAERRAEFPHEEHANLFPLCEGCHSGIPSGDRANFYPPPQSCSGCHDGVEQARVEWQGPTEEPDNLTFEHPEHPGVGEGAGPIECSTCHTQAGAPRMAVEEEPVVPRCLSCHDNRAESHFMDADCSTCHMPLAETPFGRAQLASLPEPEDHGTRDFLPEEHGELARADITRCAVCHTRERCESCHVNAALVDEIAGIPAATGIVARELPQYDAEYPVPVSHMRADFLESHGRGASVASCSTCHVRENCTSCHVAEQPAPIGDLPRAAAVTAPGVQTAGMRRRPVSHQAPLFEIEHGSDAAANGASCEMCHTRTMCADCHNAAAPGASWRHADPADDRVTAERTRMPGAFHPPNYSARHSAEAYGRRLECSNCHDSQLFCADCHESAGMSPAASGGRLRPGFHDAEPLWLLRHGQAARQGLESCTSCHRQNECMQCHSVLGAFKVSPHGAGFNARRAQQRNAAVCLVCHVTDPLNGRSG